jgi:hypothetical protein
MTIGVRELCSRRDMMGEVISKAFWPSGPLKGGALRSHGRDRLHLVGAASAVSLAGDVARTALFAEARLLDMTPWTIVLAATPLMPLAAGAGRLLTRRVREPAYAPSLGGHDWRLDQAPPEIQG